MDTAAAVQVLRVDHETLLGLARSGLVGKQKFEGEPWDFSAAEMAALLRGVRTLKGSLKEAAQLYRLGVVVLRLQSEVTDATPEPELLGLQNEALELTMNLKASPIIGIQRATRSLVKSGCGGAAQVLQVVYN